MYNKRRKSATYEYILCYILSPNSLSRLIKVENLKKSTNKIRNLCLIKIQNIKKKKKSTNNSHIKNSDKTNAFPLANCSVESSGKMKNNRSIHTSRCIVVLSILLNDYTTMYACC